MKRITLAVLATLALAGAATAATPTGTVSAALSTQNGCDVYVNGDWTSSTGRPSTVTITFSDGVQSVVSSFGVNGRNGAFVSAYTLAASGAHTVTAVVTLANKTGVLATATSQNVLACGFA